MEDILKHGAYTLDVFTEDENPVSILQDWEPCRKPKVPWVRETTLEEDMIELKKKYKNTYNEILVQHMIDSLIIFNHNRKNIGEHYPISSVPIELPDQPVTLTS